MSAARDRAVVVGLRATGAAVARYLAAKGVDVVAVDDWPDAGSRRAAEALHVELLEAPSRQQLASVVRGSSLVVASPGVPADHPVFSLAVPVISEVELAAEQITVPLVAITGTNGKTTVTVMVTRMLRESGVRAVAAGNIGSPLIECAEGDAEVVVAEVSSFQLALTRSFRPRVAAWLNVSEDHLDWHPDMAHYLASKARIWANQRPGDAAVANAEDLVVMAAAESAPVRPVTFGLASGDFRVVGGSLVDPEGNAIVALAEMPRTLPHERANALAACATASPVGATAAGCRTALIGFEGLPHRVELVGKAEGVSYYDDSKATTPASVLAALSGFTSVVLIAGGHNKGLDLGELRRSADRVRSVVAIGEAAEEVESVFAGIRPVRRASSMREAVAEAREAAESGDVVLLSPGCASFDWYGSYAERGEDFVRAVRSVIGTVGANGSGREQEGM